VKDKLFSLRLPHYVAAGGITLGVEYTTFLCAFYVLNLSGVRANTVSFAISLTVNFLLNRYWVFREGAALGAWHKQTASYVALAFSNFMITNLGLHFFIDRGLPAFAVKLFFVGLVSSWNFLLFKKYIFAASSQARDKV